jgi:signal transduction histidine kinase
MNLASQQAAGSAAGLPVAPSSDSVSLVLAPPMPRQTVMRIMMLGFGLMVLLVVGAAYVGLQGSRDIRDSAQDLIREHIVDSKRGAALESRIEKRSEELLGELFWILGSCFLLAVAGSSLTIWITHRAFQRLEWQGRELGQVSWHMLDSHEKIARRFSHEMHDELGQALAGLKGMIKRASPAEMDAMRGEMTQVLDEVLASVRELSQLLRPVILDDFGLDAALRWLTERFTQRTQIGIDYNSNFSGRLAEGLETHLFRIAQEALTNIARHSGATHAWVSFQVQGDRVRLTVEDDGRGLSSAVRAAQPSLGMVGMRARAREVNGELRVENRTKAGLRIQVEAPLVRANDGIQPEDPNTVS